MPEWNAAGYDLLRQDRFIYAFLPESGFEVKIGMVGEHASLERRRREVARRWGYSDLKLVGHAVVPKVDSQTVEHVEAVIRHWLVVAANFRHAGRVDWLQVPTPSPEDWDALLAEAVAFALDSTMWRRAPVVRDFPPPRPEPGLGSASE